MRRLIVGFQTFSNSQMEAVHEFLHALGFMHIHQRGDRDDYVTIKFANVLVNSNFLKSID